MTFHPTLSILEVKPSQYKHFSCGEPALDEYLKRYAKANEKKRISRNFILPGEDGQAIGYYTLCMAQVKFDELPEEFQSGLPHYPIPAARLCRLAVDQSMQGNGLGEHLLMDAINRVHIADKMVAAFALLVDAKNTKAKRFYQKYDFKPMKDQDLKLFIPLDTLKHM